MTRKRLMIATERLVAQSGVDGVSTRQISAEAETELGAIHHHFGTKDQLILSVLEWRVDLIDEYVEKLIQRRRKTKAELDIDDLTDFMILPYIHAVEESDGTNNYSSFLLSLSTCRRLFDRVSVDTPWNIRMLSIYEQLRPDLDAHERRRRISICTFTTIGCIADSATRAWIANTAPAAVKNVPETLHICISASLKAA